MQKKLDNIQFDNLGSYAELEGFWVQNKDVFEYRKNKEKEILESLRKGEKYLGYEIFNNESTKFSIPKSQLSNGDNLNLRETLICKDNLSSRVRASLAIFLHLTRNKILSNQRIYLTEQVTPLFEYFEKYIPGASLVGSEYVNSEMKSGEIKNGIRHEDMTSLSFEDSSLDAIVCLEVLEHIPNFKQAIQECFRVLEKDGIILFSAPFAANFKENLIRASVDQEGVITHHLEPEYHGDPMLKEGILCYQYFGWELIEYMRSIGFREVNVTTAWSYKHGILGYFEPQWYAIK